MKEQIVRAALVSLFTFGLVTTTKAQTEILNASYDISRELFIAVNEVFVPYWKQKTGQNVKVNQSHGGSSSQARAVLEGLSADVVTFNAVNDIDQLVKGKLIGSDWQSRYPNNASPFYSVTTILVRKGNPKGIKDWDDLAKKGVTIVQVNPKTGGNGRYAVLAYHGYALKKFNGDEAKAREFLKNILANVSIFEKGGRAATSTFTERGIGDVLVTFEAEALQLASQPDSKYEVVTPSSSVVADFPVAVVDKVAARRKTTDIAAGYLAFLYTPEAQEILAENYYRTRDADAAKKSFLKKVNTFEISELYTSADEAQKKFFDNKALVDELLAEVATLKR